jgi:hypothetical protein
MPCCLFTNSQLGAATREEHTIQRSLGGRIRSREVSSNGFNERCGALIDTYFRDLYANTMAILGPALPGASRAGDQQVQIPGQPGRYVIDEHGNLTMRGAAVIQRDPASNRPTAVLGVEEPSLRRIIEQISQPGGTEHRTNVMPPSQDVLHSKRAVLCSEIELAALKAVLLSFDHLLRREPDRFTRSPALQEVREFVRRSVMEDSPLDNLLMQRFVLGLQYEHDYLAAYEDLRRKADFPETSFEHVLIASANPATRTLDLVFWAYRVDPYAFRVCDDWRGQALTYVVVNGVLAGTTFSEAIRLDGGRLLGRPTQRRSNFHVTTPFGPVEQTQLRQELFERRANLYRQAVDYVERSFDDIAIENLKNYAWLNPDGDYRLATAVIKRLAVMFHRRIQEVEARLLFDQIVARVLSGAPDDLSPPPSDVASAPVVDWPRWLTLIRQSLDALREPFGLPGDIYQAISDGIVWESDGRLLGHWPDELE